MASNRLRVGKTYDLSANFIAASFQSSVVEKKKQEAGVSLKFGYSIHAIPSHWSASSEDIWWGYSASLHKRQKNIQGPLCSYPRTWKQNRSDLIGVGVCRRGRKVCQLCWILLHLGRQLEARETNHIEGIEISARCDVKESTLWLEECDFCLADAKGCQRGVGWVHKAVPHTEELEIALCSMAEVDVWHENVQACSLRRSTEGAGVLPRLRVFREEESPQELQPKAAEKVRTFETEATWQDRWKPENEKVIQLQLRTHLVVELVVGRSHYSVCASTSSSHREPQIFKT